MSELTEPNGGSTGEQARPGKSLNVIQIQDKGI